MQLTTRSLHPAVRVGDGATEPGAPAPGTPAPGTPDAAVVEPAGFTLVEEDDVAFSLRLCREVHLLYGDYQEGLLPETDQVMAGLTVTVEMLAALSRSVRDGMPGMRVTVAGAQTREMLAVMFGRDPLQGPLDRSCRNRYRTMVDESAIAALAGGVEPSPVPAVADHAEAGSDGPDGSMGRRRSGLLRLFRRRR